MPRLLAVQQLIVTYRYVVIGCPMISTVCTYRNTFFFFFFLQLDKINLLKQSSEALREPVRTQMQTEQISISHDAYQILKFHGSYMQDDRSLRKKGQEKVKPGRRGRRLLLVLGGNWWKPEGPRC